MYDKQCYNQTCINCNKHVWLLTQFSPNMNGFPQTCVYFIKHEYIINDFMIEHALFLSKNVFNINEF